MKPIRRVGAASPFGLALPSATPTAGQLYGPRGAWLDDARLVVADTGNHRVLIWHDLPASDGAEADVVLGQPDFTSEGQNAGGRGPEHGLAMPTGVLVHEGRLVVADSWNHRVLVWNRLPEAPGTRPDVVLGQDDLSGCLPQRGAACGPTALYWPYGIGVVDGWFWVTDTGNRRVVGWPGLPEPGQAPAVVLGQPDASANDENRGGAASAASFRWPHAVAGHGGAFFVADAGNHRVLGWHPRPEGDAPASSVLGQPSFAATEELPHRKQGAHRLRFPYAVASEADTLAVADTANNRVLLWDGLPGPSLQRPADHVIGQPDFDQAGENRWKQVADDTLCWPYGLWLHGDRLAVADSGNNRVVLWDITRPMGEATPRDGRGHAVHIHASGIPHSGSR